jgi:molybdate transport system permease protein
MATQDAGALDPVAVALPSEDGGRSGRETDAGRPVGSRREPALVAGGALAAVLMLFLALPVVALVVRAFIGEAFVDVVRQEVLLDALALSLVSTLVSLALAVIFGTPLAYLLARRRFRGAGLVETLVDLPIVLPPSVAGLALLLLLGRRGALGGPLDALGLEIPFTTLAVILAQAFVATPFYVRSARSGFLSIDRDLEDAARVDGAGELDVIRRISVPLAAPAIAAGLVMTWARALGEFGATIMFAGNVEGRTQTLPLLVYSEFQSSLDASVAAAAILVVAAAGVLLGVRLLHWRSVFDLRAVS